MQKYLDEICLLLLSGILSIAYIQSGFAVVGFLLSVIVVGFQSLDNHYFRCTALLLFCVFACTFSAVFCFLALVAYAAMHERSWLVRFIWLLPCVVQTVVVGGYSLFLLWVEVLCLVGCILGIQDARHVSEYRGLQRAYDALKERTFKLSHKTAGEASGDVSVEEACSTLNTSEASFFDGLTERELAVVNLVAEGLDNREISQRLFLSEGTVRNHISSILSKKNLQNRTQIAIMYYRS